MVVVFGSINLDLVARVPRLPRPGETIAGTDFAMAPGGKGANQALAARRAGAAVAMFGAVGSDAFAAAALGNLVAAGVDLAGVAAVPASTGVALINVDARGENAITVVAGANAHARAALVPAAAIGAGTTLLMQLEVPVPEVAALAARAAGARVVLNAAPAEPLPGEVWRAVDVLLVNEREALEYANAWQLPATPASFIAAMDARFGVAVVVTLGARGAITLARGALREVAPPSVTVVDTTGAGDAFAGALAAALDRGTPLPEAMEAAVRAGALACTHPGAQRPP
jgi:ribokinase